MKYLKGTLAAGCLLASIGMADAQGLGFVSLSGEVNAAGVMGLGQGFSATSRSGTGIYLITFTRDISQCVFMVTPRGRDGGQASVLVFSATKVQVYTFSKVGVATNLPFSLVASCSS